MLDLIFSILFFFLLGISSLAFGAIGALRLMYFSEKKDEGTIGVHLINHIHHVFLLTLFTLSFFGSYFLYQFFASLLESFPVGVFLASFFGSLLLTGFFSISGLAMGGSEQGKPLAQWLGFIVSFWELLFRPVVLVVALFANPVLALFVKKIQKEDLALDEQENTSLDIQEKEEDVLQNVLRLTDRDASALMTNRSEVLWVDINDDWAEMDSVIKESGYTKFPICSDELDNVIGVLKLRDFIENKEQSKKKLKKQLSPAINVPEHMSALRVLEIFKKERTYFAFVVDEFGTTLGIVTLHDLVEYIFGALPDIDDDEEPPVVVRKDGSLLVNGMIPVEEIFDYVPIRIFEKNDEEDYNTLAGYILSNMEEMPETGDVLTLDGYHFEIVDMDRNRIDKVLISKVRA